MKVRITPSNCSGNVVIPPSKSMAHRAIICASLASGKSTITNVAYSQDILATISGMNALGARIDMQENALIIHGIADFSSLQQSDIDCCESGSTLRFFIPLFSLCNTEVRFIGSTRLLQRPQHIYEEIFKKQGIYFHQHPDRICIKETLHPGDFFLEGNVSSQFISGLLFTLPLLKEDSTIHIRPPYESKSYVDLTIQMVRSFGISIILRNDHTIYIPGCQMYSPFDYEVEGDYSQLAFFAVLAAIKHDLTLTGVSHDSLQGDKAILDILTSFGTKIDKVKNGYKIYKSSLRSCDINLQNCPDLGPILTVLGMYSSGNTRIYHAERLRIKESDRIAAMECELQKFDVRIACTNSELHLQGATQHHCTQELHGHNDHRIVMALSIAAMCSTSSCVIQDAQAINKSYPTFFDDLISIQGKVEIL